MRLLKRLPKSRGSKTDFTLKKYAETQRYKDPKKTGTGNKYASDGRSTLGEYFHICHYILKIGHLLIISFIPIG